jgi:hypothetical protein
MTATMFFFGKSMDCLLFNFLWGTIYSLLILSILVKRNPSTQKKKKKKHLQVWLGIQELEFIIQLESSHVFVSFEYNFDFFY